MLLVVELMWMGALVLMPHGWVLLDHTKKNELLGDGKIFWQ